MHEHGNWEIFFLICAIMVALVHKTKLIQQGSSDFIMVHTAYVDSTYLTKMKPCVLGPGIRDIEANSYKWSHLLVNV